jgi:5-oxopent-3-ene-1,2,5-tricarboxylate decarboxylase/2-hydroxyhepta-2,4-diene-1,7-dioate isomerase
MEVGQPLTQLLADVNEFMTLQAGDVLMLGLDICTQGPDAGHRPLARVGDVIEIQVPGLAGLGVMRHTLVAAPALEMPA